LPTASNHSKCCLFLNDSHSDMDNEFDTCSACEDWCDLRDICANSSRLCVEECGGSWCGSTENLISELQSKIQQSSHDHDASQEVSDCFDSETEALRKEAAAKHSWDMVEAVGNGMIAGAGVGMGGISTAETSVQLSSEKSKEAIVFMSAALATFAATSVLGSESANREHERTVAGMDRQNCAQVAAVATMQLIKRQHDETKVLVAGESNKTRQAILESEARLSRSLTRVEDKMSVLSRDIRGDIQQSRQLAQQERRSLFALVKSNEEYRRQRDFVVAQDMQALSNQMGVLAAKLDRLKLAVEQVEKTVEMTAYHEMTREFLAATNSISFEAEAVLNVVRLLTDQDDKLMEVNADLDEINRWRDSQDRVQGALVTKLNDAWKEVQRSLSSIVVLGQSGFFDAHAKVVSSVGVQEFVVGKSCRTIIENDATALRAHLREKFSEDKMIDAVLSAVGSAIGLQEDIANNIPGAAAPTLTWLIDTLTQVKTLMMNAFSSRVKGSEMLVSVLNSILPVLCPASTPCKGAGSKDGIVDTERWVELQPSLILTHFWDLVSNVEGATKSCTPFPDWKPSLHRHRYEEDKSCGSTNSPEIITISWSQEVTCPAFYQPRLDPGAVTAEFVVKSERMCFDGGYARRKDFNWTVGGNIFRDFFYVPYEWSDEGYKREGRRIARKECKMAGQSSWSPCTPEWFFGCVYAGSSGSRILTDAARPSWLTFAADSPSSSWDEEEGRKLLNLHWILQYTQAAAAGLSAVGFRHQFLLVNKYEITVKLSCKAKPRYTESAFQVHRMKPNGEWERRVQFYMLPRRCTIFWRHPGGGQAAISVSEDGKYDAITVSAHDDRLCVQKNGGYRHCGSRYPSFNREPGLLQTNRKFMVKDLRITPMA